MGGVARPGTAGTGIAAPSGSTNDYAGFIVEEDIDSLLLEASQVFERVNGEGSDELDELFLQASQSYESEHCIVSGMPNVPVTRSSDGGERKVAASGPSSCYGSPKSAKPVEKVAMEVCSSEEDEAKH